MLDTWPFGISIAVNQAYDLSLVVGQLTAYHEPDALPLLDTKPVSIANDLQYSLSSYVSGCHKSVDEDRLQSPSGHARVANSLKRSKKILLTTSYC